MTALTWIERDAVWEAIRPGTTHGLYATCRRRTIGANDFTVWAVSYADGKTMSWDDLAHLDVYPDPLNAKAAVETRWAAEHPSRRFTYAATTGLFNQTDPKLTVEIADGDEVERWEIPLTDLLTAGSGANGRNLTAWHTNTPDEPPF